MKELFFKNLNRQKGMAMIETLAYIFILVLLVEVLIGTLTFLNSSYHQIKSIQNIEQTAQSALERLVREIRGGTSWDTAQSSFGASPGRLTINTTGESGTPTSLEFYVASSTIYLKEGGVEKGPLSPSSTKVTNLIFRPLVGTQSKAVKIEMTVESGQGKNYYSKKFYSTVVLRGSYPLQ